MDYLPRFSLRRQANEYTVSTLTVPRFAKVLATGPGANNLHWSINLTPVIPHNDPQPRGEWYAIAPASTPMTSTDAPGHKASDVHTDCLALVPGQ